MTDSKTTRPNLDDVDLDSLDWCKSSYSNGAGGMCIEVAEVPGGGVVIRDTATPETVIPVALEDYRAFTDGVRDGELLF
jgi:hypothetical protein